MPKRLIRTACQLCLLAVLVIAARIAFTKGISLSEYTPNQTFRNMGLPYAFILGYEHHFHLFLHFITTLLVTLLLYGAGFFSKSATPVYYCGLMTLLLALGVEAIQSRIGRNVEVIDLLMAVSGIVTALWVLVKTGIKNPV